MSPVKKEEMIDSSFFGYVNQFFVLCSCESAALVTVFPYMLKSKEYHLLHYFSQYFSFIATANLLRRLRLFQIILSNNFHQIAFPHSERKNNL